MAPPSSTSSKTRRRLWQLAVGSVALATTIGLLPTPAVDLAEPAAAQTPLVPETPSTGYPVIQYSGTYEVFAADQVGDYILSGGDFQQVRLQNGTL
ncbi:MAG: hypothetical protein KDB16_10865, partial [Acidimicrobiales bacterium]|nr:hypothetical protein [Acidimicrobiales bacterium]